MKNTNSECFDSLMRRRESARKEKLARRRTFAVLIPAAACLAAVFCLSPFMPTVSTGEIGNSADNSDYVIGNADIDKSQGGDIGNINSVPSSLGESIPAVRHDGDTSGAVNPGSEGAESGMTDGLPEDTESKLVFNKASSSTSGEVIIPDGCYNEYRTYGQLFDYYGVDFRLDYPDGFSMKTDIRGETYGCILRMLDGKLYADNARFYYYIDGDGFDITKGVIIQEVAKGNIPDSGSNTLYFADTVTELQTRKTSVINGVSVILAETEQGEYYACFRRGDASVLLTGSHIDKNSFVGFINTAIRGEK